MKLLIVLVLSLSLTSFAKEGLDLVGGYYKYRRHSIIFECVERIEKKCRSARGVLIKGKPSKIKKVLGKGKDFAFSEEIFQKMDLKSSEIKEINSLFLSLDRTGSATILGLVYPTVAMYFANDGEEKASPLAALVLIPATAITTSIGLAVDIVSLPFRLLWAIPERVINKRLEKRNLAEPEHRGKVYKSKRMRVSKNVFNNLKRELEISKF